jgi:hypothetical protein
MSIVTRGLSDTANIIDDALVTRGYYSQVAFVILIPETKQIFWGGKTHGEDDRRRREEISVAAILKAINKNEVFLKGTAGYSGLVLENSTAKITSFKKSSSSKTECKLIEVRGKINNKVQDIKIFILDIEKKKY